MRDMDREAAPAGRPPLSSPWASNGDKIMIQETPQAEQFKQQMRNSLRQKTLNAYLAQIA
jgi:hypothetical protein